MDDLDRALETWRRANFTATAECITGAPYAPPLAQPRWICRIYQGLVPHSWETRGVYAEGNDRREVIVAALRQAAERYPGVV